MDLGPILRSLMHNKTRLVLISFEVALTLAIVVNCLNMIVDFRARMTRPTGLDEANLIAVTCLPFAPAYKEKGFPDKVRDEDLRSLRAMPGVRAATAISQFPLSGSGSSTGRKPAGSTIDSITAPYYTVADQAVATFGVEIVAGRDFVPADFVHPDPKPDEQEHDNVLLTKDLADRLFPGGDALGKDIEGGRGGSRDTIVGIIGQMHNSWPQGQVAERVMLFPERPGSDRNIRYLIRTEGGQRDEVARLLEPALLRLQDGRILKVETLEELKADTYSDYSGLTWIFGAVGALLLAVTSLGIIGLTSFSVTERTRQIGTRRALGATRPRIVRHFLVETGLITGFGLALGAAIAYGLNFALVKFAEAPKLGVPLIGGGMAVLAAAALLAALGPALRGCRVSPVVATRTV